MKVRDAGSILRSLDLEVKVGLWLNISQPRPGGEGQGCWIVGGWWLVVGGGCWFVGVSSFMLIFGSAGLRTTDRERERERERELERERERERPE